MVSYKRQPVALLPMPENLHDSDDVWVMRLSNEVFTDYESYLDRHTFLSQKKFTCDITGRSGLTYFQAKESEMAGSSAEVQVSFPDKLKEHVLRKVHHCATARLDDLVNITYDALQTEFFPGETVVTTSPELADGPVTILEKMDNAFGGFHNRPNMFGPQDPIPAGMPFTRYRVRFSNGSEAFVFPSDLRRDRRVFNKLVLRSFLKNSVWREPTRGSPWQAKAHLCQEFNLPTKLPEEYTQWFNKALKNVKTAYKIADKENSFNNFILSQKTPLAIRPPQPKPGKGALAPQAMNPQNMQQIPITNYFIHGAQPMFHAQLPIHQMGVHHPGGIMGPPHMNGMLQFAPPTNPFQAQQIQPRVVISQNSRKNAKQTDGGSRARTVQPAVVAPPRPPSPPPIKYPIEDLDVVPFPGTRVRPPLKFFTERVPGLEESNMTGFLNCWATMNVHHEFFVIDTFTIDDFAEAMSITDVDLESELFIEIHCAVLKRIVDSDGHLLARGMDSDEESEESDDSEESEESREPTPPPARSTRSSLAKQQAEQLRRSPSPKITTRAREVLASFDWVNQLKERGFGDGGWEMIVVGILRHAFVHAPYFKEKCHKILSHLAPADMEPNAATVVEQYATMDVNLRVETLELLQSLVFTTREFQDHIKACGNRQTEIRREVAERKKVKNVLVDDFIKLDNERKIMAPEYLKDTEPNDISLPDAHDVEEEDDKEEGSSDEDAPVVRMRSLRNAGKREEERRRKKEEREAKEAARKARKRQLNPYEQILEKIDVLKADIKEHEELISEAMQQIKELNVNRTEPLGHDRYGNTYFFYERNGMPILGDPDASTASYEYMSGRLWVQGPLASTYESNMNLPDDLMAEHKKIFGLTPLERKARDEGETRLTDTSQWGYYDTPDSLDRLLAWLDERGERELRLKRDLTKFKGAITDCMTRMNKHLAEVEEEKRAASEEAEGRMSTRKRVYDEQEREYKCLLWTNNKALRELGHLHSQEPVKKRRGKKGEPKGKAKKKEEPAPPPEPQKRETRSGRKK